MTLGTGDVARSECITYSLAQLIRSALLGNCMERVRVAFKEDLWSEFTLAIRAYGGEQRLKLPDAGDDIAPPHPVLYTCADVRHEHLGDTRPLAESQHSRPLNLLAQLVSPQRGSHAC